MEILSFHFSSVQSLSRVQLFATPWTAAHQAYLSIMNSQSSPELMSIESVMPSNHLILCCPLFLLPTIFPSITVFSNESVLCIRWKAILSLSQAHILAVISENPSSKPAYSTLGNTTVGPFKIYLVSDSVFPPAMPPSSALTHTATGACWLVSHSGHPTWLPSLNTAARVIFLKHVSLPVCPSEYRPEVHTLIPPMHT